MADDTKDALKHVLDELFGLLESLETKSEAVLEFLKDEGLTTDERLAPYLEQAGKASNIRWLAARKRMEYLLTPIETEGKARVESREPATAKVAENRDKADKTKRESKPDKSDGGDSELEDESAKANLDDRPAASEKPKSNATPRPAGAEKKSAAADKSTKNDEKPRTHEDDDKAPAKAETARK